MAQGRVDQPVVPDVLRNHDTRLQGLERTVGRWIYVTPIAPASAPVTGVGTDPLSPPFLNGVTNVAGKQALSFRLWPATKVQIRGALDLHGASFPVVVFTLPAAYRPPNPVPIQFPSVSSGATYTGVIATNGDVSITGRGDALSSYLGAFSAGDQLLTPGSPEAMVMNDPPDILIGSDIELVSSTTVQINTDGWYSISFNPVISGFDATSLGTVNCFMTSSGSPEYGWFGQIGSFLTTIDINGAVDSASPAVELPSAVYTLPPINFGVGATFSFIARLSTGFAGTPPSLSDFSAAFVLRER